MVTAGDVDLEQEKRDAQASLAVHKDVHKAKTPDEYIEETDNPAYSELGDWITSQAKLEFIEWIEDNPAFAATLTECRVNNSIISLGEFETILVEKMCF